MTGNVFRITGTFREAGILLQARCAARTDDRPSSACDEHAGTSRYR